MMVKLKDGRRTCSCKIGTSLQSLGPDYRAEVLHLLDPLGYPEGQIDYVRGLENHPHRGTDPDIQRALNLITRTNTRRPPDVVSSSEDSEGMADDEGPFHGYRTSDMSTSTEEQPAETNRWGNYSAADREELDRILGIIQGTITPEQPPRRHSTTRDDTLEAGTPTQDQARRVPPRARRRRTLTPPHSSSSEEDATLRIKLRSQRVLMKAPRKKGKKKGARR